MTVQPSEAWQDVKALHGAAERLLAGPQLSYQLRHCPEHLAMVLARYRAAAALIGSARSVLEVGCGEGIGAGILWDNNRRRYLGIDSDADAIELASGLHNDHRRMTFLVHDATGASLPLSGRVDAVVSLDVIEHIPAAEEERFLGGITAALGELGVCVVGTPSAHAHHLASEASRRGHVNLYTPQRLHELLGRHFRLVQSFGMQDTSLHLGHPDMRHYLLAVGIGPR